ncbi:MAG: S8/S53 family peptidase [Anaerolineae bacterium]|nr:S8/S53 family peptidase [Anaerolineae bacterium]
MCKRKLSVMMAVILLLLSVPLTTLAQRGGQDLSESNCALTPDQIMGQAFSSTAGAVGETSNKGLTPQGEDIEANGLDAQARWIMMNLPYAAGGREPVAILVIDDFSDDGTGSRPPSHGWLVMQVLEQLQAQLPGNLADKIRLTRVNIADEVGYQSDFIQPAVERAMNTLAEAGITRFVLNMSFVFIPCVDTDLGFNFGEFRQAHQNNPTRSIVEQVGGNVAYVRSLLQDSRISVVEENSLEMTDVNNLRGQGRVTSGRQIPPTPAQANPSLQPQNLRVLRLFNNARLQSDPLRDFLRQTARGRIVVPVASSGNFKQRQPFFPARWPEVISVSANEGNDFRFWLQSNNAAVSVPGAWFLFDDGEYRAGTSFAAPVVSLLIAMDLTQSQPRCALRGGTSALARGNYDNTLIGDVVRQFC